MKSALVLGAGGFIGSHMVTYLRRRGYTVRGVDLKYPQFSPVDADDFVIGDLRDQQLVAGVLDAGKLDGSDFTFDEVYQFAADMGGAGYIFTGDNDADIMHNSATINLNVLDALRAQKRSVGGSKTKIFYSSSACVYPEHNQLDPGNPDCREETIYPAQPDSEYGWEKIFSERLYASYARNHGIPVAVARYHNIFGPQGTFQGGREKAPAAICRKVAELGPDGGEIEVWGDGLQTRSFLYVDECVEATYRLMQSDFADPVNIGSEEMVTINELVELAAKASGKTVRRRHILDAPLGVRGRNSNNDLIRKVLGWDYAQPLAEGIARTYRWIDAELAAQNRKEQVSQKAQVD